MLENAGNKSLTDFVQECHEPDDSYKNPPESTIRSLMHQLFTATDYLHKNYICHRDLKPDNIIIRESEEEKTLNIKVIDFNVAVEVSKTNPRIRGGTGLREWSAPETYRSFYSDFKIDSWTLGCVMFFLCTGQQPFDRQQSEMQPEINFESKLASYSESETFPDMVDFIRNLIMVDPICRLSSEEALDHPWLKSENKVESMGI